MRATIIIALMFISACGITPQQRAETTIKLFGPYCEGLGYKPDTDPWRDCIIQTSTK